MFRVEAPSTSLRAGFPEQIANEACEKRHWECPTGEMQRCLWWDAYLFVNGEQQIRENINCGRGDRCQSRRNQKTVLKRQFHERTTERVCLFLPDPLPSAIKVFSCFADSTWTHSML